MKGGAKSGVHRVGQGTGPEAANCSFNAIPDAPTKGVRAHAYIKKLEDHILLKDELLRMSSNFVLNFIITPAVRTWGVNKPPPPA